MRKVFKKAIFVLIFSVIVFGAIPLSELSGLDLPEFGNLQKLTASVSEFFGGLSVKAETPEYTNGYYTYTVDENGNATITDVDTSISGDITIPSTLDGYPVTIIGDYAFASCTNLTGIVIPDGVTSIGTHAFQNCKNLENATIPNKVVSLGGGAFYNCSKLTNITIPENVTSIGNGAFYGCKGLVTVFFKATNCETMGSKDYPVFNGCTALKTVIIENNVETIPAYAFNRCYYLTNVTISDKITNIDEGVFYGCSKLTNISMPQNLVSIGASAFYGTGLTNFTIPDGVIAIGDGAFRRCLELESVTIPKDIADIGGNIFSDCSNLTDITISNGVTSISNYMFSKCTSLTDITIPNSVTAIGKGAFSGCSGLTNITIHKDIKSIGEYAFYGCTGLTLINYNAINCETMGSTSWPVFSGCSTPLTLNIGENVESIPAYAFYKCTGLNNLKIPDNVTNIGDYAFGNCTEITNIIIGEYVATIGKSSFYNCSGITNITIPENVIYIGENAFDCCSGIKTINYNAVNAVTAGDTSDIPFSDCSAIENIIIGNKVETIPAYMFYNCRNVANVIIGTNVTHISNCAFEYCVNLTSITIPGNITNIGSAAFRNCAGLNEVIVHNGVISIGDKAFEGCTNLGNLVFPNSVISIGEHSFSGCTSLENVTLPCNLISVGRGAFSKTSLTNIAIPDSVTSIDDEAFMECTKLKTAALGKNLSDFGLGVFGYCNNLETVYYNAKKCSNNGGVFFSDSQTPSLTTVTIGESVEVLPSHLVYDCKINTVNYNAINCTLAKSVFENNSSIKTVVFGNKVENIPNYLFFSCNGITNIMIPDSVKNIGDYAFYNCEEIKNLCIGNGVKSIGANAFYACNNISSITIPNEVTYLGSCAFGSCLNLEVINFNAINCTTGGASVYSVFWNCISVVEINIGDKVEVIPFWCFYGTGVTSVVIPDNVKTIGERAFCGCSNLISVTIEKNVTDIGDYAFYRCDDLTFVSIPESIISIGKYAFGECRNISKIYYGGSEEEWEEISNRPYAENIYYNSKISKSDKISISKDIYTCFEGERVFVSGDMYAADGISNVTLHWSSGDGVEVLAPASIINSDANNASFSVEVKGLSAGMHSVTVYTSSGKSDSCIINVIKLESELVVSVGGAGEYYFVDGKLLDGELNEVDEIPFKVTVENRLKDGSVSELSDELKEKLMIKNVKVSSALSDYSGLLIDIEDMNNLQNIGDLQVGEKKEFTLNVYPNNFKLPENEITLDTVASASEQSDISIITTIEIKDKLYEPQAIVSFNVFNPNIIYNDKKYDSESIEVSVRVTNRIPSSFSGNAAKLGEISDCNITVSEIKISSEDSKLLSDAGIRIKDLNTVLRAGESTIIKETYHINTKYKMDEKVESETVGFSYNVSTSANSPRASKSVTFVNKDCKIEQIKNENINKAAEKAADALANLKKGHKGEAQITLDPRLSNVFTKSEIEQIQDYILTQILLQSLSDESMTDEIVDKFLEYVDEKVDEENNIDEELKEDLKAFLGSFNPDVSVYNKDIDMDIVIETKNHGTITMNIKTSVMKTDLDDSNVASSGHLTYTIEGDNLPQGITSTEFISPLAIVDVTNFMEAAEELVIEEIAALYSEIWGNDLDKVVDIVCGKTVNDILAHTEYKSAKGLVFAAMVNPVKRFCAKCPVDIFVYDSEGKLCVAVENDIISKTSEKALVSVNGSEKTVLLLDETYSVIFKPTGNDATMDITIEEFANSSSLLRTINFKDVPLEFGEHYSQTITSETLADKSNYALTHDTSGEKIQADSVEKILHYHTIGEYETVSDAKCNQASIIRGKCTICFDTVLCSTDIFGECKAGEWIVEAEATLTSEGKKVKSCLYCGEILEEEIIPKLSEDNPNDTPTNPSEPVTPPAGEETTVAVVVRNPSTTTISYGDAIILHADVTGTLPAGATIKWEASNSNFAMEVSADGTTCKILPSSKGDTTFTVSVIDANGNVISSDEQVMTSKAGFFDKIIAFFKKLFGLTKTIPQVFKGII